MKKYLILVLAIIFVGCQNCDVLQSYMKDEHCTLIVENKPSTEEVYFNFKGRDLKNRPCECIAKNSYRWWNSYREYIDIGDTIVKKKGELTFNIHKKDTVLSFLFDCTPK